jgi:hypothetical protein
LKPGILTIVYSINLQMTDPKLYELVEKLCAKIEVLERKIDNMSMNKSFDVSVSQIRRINGLNDPSQNFNEWLNDIQVTDESILLVTSNLVTAFQSVVKPLLTASDVPFYKHNTKLYVFDHTRTWVQWDEENLGFLVREVWRKFMKAHLAMTYDHEELYLAQRKNIVDMRRKLIDVKKTRCELSLWLKQII